MRGEKFSLGKRRNGGQVGGVTGQGVKRKASSFVDRAEAEGKAVTGRGKRRGGGNDKKKWGE